ANKGSHGQGLPSVKKITPCQQSIEMHENGSAVGISDMFVGNCFLSTYILDLFECVLRCIECPFIAIGRCSIEFCRFTRRSQDNGHQLMTQPPRMTFGLDVL